MGAFNVENRFWTFLNRLTDLFLLSALQFLFSIPLVTAGAAAAGCYNGMLRIAEGSDRGVWRDFKSGFRAGFKTATGIWLIQLILSALLLFNAFVSLRSGSSFGLFAACIDLILLLFVVIIAFYAYPISSRYSFGLKKTLRDAMVMATAHLPHSFSLAVLFAVAVWLSVKLPYVCIIAPPVFLYQVARVCLWIFNGCGKTENGSEEKCAGCEEHPVI